jgi:hypothetical protein
MVSIYHRAIKHLLNHAGMSWDDYCKFSHTKTLEISRVSGAYMLPNETQNFKSDALSENMKLGTFLCVLGLLDDDPIYKAGKDNNDAAWCSQQSVLLEDRKISPGSVDAGFVLSETCREIRRVLRIDTEEFDQLRDDYLDLKRIDDEQQVMDIVSDLQAPVLRVANFYVFLAIINPRITWMDVVEKMAGCDPTKLMQGRL